MKVDVILGLQWGDEGKGKIVDVLSSEYDIVARFQGGPNAGHTIEFEGKKFVLHQIPSGIFDENKINLIGNGVLIDPVIFAREVQFLESCGIDPRKNLLISRKAHLIQPGHRLLDTLSEKTRGQKQIGSTLKGISPAYADKTSRSGLRVGNLEQENFHALLKESHQRHLRIASTFDIDLKGITIEGYTFEEYHEKWQDSVRILREFRFADSEYFLNHSLDQGKKILAEGAQGSMLDLDFGTYPFVTSSNTISGGVCCGLGIPPSRLGEVFGVFKAYCTRVGNGPFPTEILDDTGIELRNRGHEYGATTGRPRRCGWLDLVALRYTIMLNGVTQLIITKGDVLSGFEKLKINTRYAYPGGNTDQVLFNFSILEPVYTEIEGWKQSIDNCHSFESLPEQFKNYITFIENFTGKKITLISTGSDRKQIIRRPIDS